MIVQVSTLHPIKAARKSVVPISKLVLVVKLGIKSVSVYVCVNAPVVPASTFAPSTPSNQYALDKLPLIATLPAYCLFIVAVAFLAPIPVIRSALFERVTEMSTPCPNGSYVSSDSV